MCRGFNFFFVNMAFFPLDHVKPQLILTTMQVAAVKTTACVHAREAAPVGADGNGCMGVCDGECGIATTISGDVF
jgi:hypothetical protein